MSYEIIVLDLDGTLLNSKKEITPATRQALIDIQKAGKKVVLASGRSEHGVISYAEELELDKYGSYVLSYNGARIRQCASNELIYNLTIPNEIISPIYDIVKEYPNVDLGIDTPDTYYYGICKNPYNELESQLCDIPLIYKENLPQTVDFPVNALLMTGEPETLVELEKHLLGIYGNTYGVFRSEPFYLRVMPQGVDKAQSLQRLLIHMGLTREEMICCGDGYNDRSMIEFAGLGVAMENAKPATKEAANFITKSNDEDGVLYVIERFMKS